MITTVMLVELECWYRDSEDRCGRHFAVTHDTERWMREEGGAVYCPAGHRICYGDTELSRLRDQLTRERAAHDQDLAKLRSTERNLRRTKKRVAVGVCPCCHRTFQALARHMKTKHPTYPLPGKETV